MTDKLEYEISSGNVFQDLGLANAEERLAKAKLASKIIEILENRHLTKKSGDALYKKPCLLLSIPNMRESIKKGLETPLGECDKDLDW